MFEISLFLALLLSLLSSSYADLLTLGIPENYRVASAKLKAESVGNPHITLYNSANFKGKFMTVNFTDSDKTLWQMSALKLHLMVMNKQMEPQMEKWTNGKVEK